MDATVDLVKQYQARSVDLVKLEAAACYVRGIQILRRQVVLLAAVLFLVATAGVAVIVVPLVWLALAPWPAEVKLWLAALLGVLDIGLPLGALAHLFSEKKWMELSRSDELMENVLKKDQG